MVVMVAEFDASFVGFFPDLVHSDHIPASEFQKNRTTYSSEDNIFASH